MIEVKDYVSVKVDNWDELIEVKISSTSKEEVVAKIKEGLSTSSTLEEVLRVLKDNEVKLEGLSIEREEDVFRLSFGRGVEVELSSDAGIQNELMIAIHKEFN